MGIQRVPNLLRWTVLACCLPYPGDPKSAIDCFFLFGISLHPGVTGSAPHWKFRGCRVHSFPSPQELLRPASWLALLSRTFTFELAPTRSPSISVEYDYVDKQSIPTAGLSPASPTALWAAGHRISRSNDELTPDFPRIFSGKDDELTPDFPRLSGSGTVQVQELPGAERRTSVDRLAVHRPERCGGPGWSRGRSNGAGAACGRGCMEKMRSRPSYRLGQWNAPWIGPSA